MNFDSPFTPPHVVLPTTIHIQPLTPTVINKSKLQYEDEPTPQLDRALSLPSSSDEEDEDEEEEEDDLSLDNESERSSTPPTPCSSGCNNYTTTKTSHSTDTYLNFIEPRPVPPPSYDTLPPGGCPRFPVSAPAIFSFSTDADGTADALPPAYKPAIYKIGVVARKIEWISSEELSPNRSWKYYIVELNSTQLNFYNVPSRHESQVVNFRTNPLLKQQPITHLDSIFTNHEDYQFYRMVKSLGLLRSRDRKHQALDKSYSLQNAKIGLATDYKKRSNVLRMKVEDEQILLDFSTVQDVINWNLLLNVGKDVSIDLAERELPKYRTVPRRRRRRNREHGGDTSTSSSHHRPHLHHGGHASTSLLNTIHHTGSFARLRSVSDPNKFRGTFSRLKSKISGYNKTLAEQQPPSGISSSAISSYSGSSRSATPTQSTSSSRSASPSASPAPQPPTPVFASPAAEVTRSYSAPNLMDVLQQNDSHHDDEEEEDDDFDQASISSVDNTHEDDDSSYSYKWNPAYKKFDVRKYHRDCLRCIKPLFYS
ncbi:hypothetical protein Cantr_00555 [Candida viswanathii]|uniref:PH domain-containing protein n=1 Tax=Candida viswanathii TaxID=5486 RepID=A0A367YGC6_9ASCO|nr:hypothetical protein Cantr_00555 [Candida viswanathii]